MCVQEDLIDLASGPESQMEAADVHNQLEDLIASIHRQGRDATSNSSPSLGDADAEAPTTSADRVGEGL